MEGRHSCKKFVPSIPPARSAVGKRCEIYERDVLGLQE